MSFDITVIDIRIDNLCVLVYPIFTFDFEIGFQISLKSLKHVWIVPGIHAWNTPYSFSNLMYPTRCTHAMACQQTCHLHVVACHWIRQSSQPAAGAQ